MKSCRFVAAFAATSRSTTPEITSSIRDCANVCIWKYSPAAIASVISSGRSSRIRSWMREFVTITSIDGHAAAVDARQQALADHAAQRAGEDRANLLLLRGREELDHAADRLGRVDRVQGGEDEVARLGRLERGVRGLGVAELADQDHVRVLTEDAAQRLLEARGVEADLALVDDAAAVRVQDLDRVLDRDDVLPPGAVDVVDHRRERRRLARAGRAGDEHETAALLGEPGDAAREPELEEVRDLARDHAEGKRGRATLAKPVDPEARQGRVRVGDVEVAGVLERVPAPRRDHRDGVEHRVEIHLGERRDAVHLLQIAVEPYDRRLAELQVDVAGAAFDGGPEEGDEIDHVQRTSARGAISFTPFRAFLARPPAACLGQLSSDAARDARNEAERRAREATCLVRMPDVATQQPADDAEDARRAGRPEAHGGMSIERALGRPRRAGVVIEPLRQRRRVAREIAVENGLGREPSRREGLVHPVTRERIDEPGSIPDEEDAARARVSWRRCGASGAGARERR